MFYLLTIIAFLSAIAWAVRIQRNKALSLEYRYKFYNLRDSLRNALIEEKIKNSDWTFDFLDHSFSKVVNQLEFITIYKVIYLTFRHKDDATTRELISKVHVSVDRNNELKRIFDAYGKLLLSFFKEKHKTLIAIATCCSGSIAVIKSFKIFLIDKILALRTLPETSDYSYARV
jgi:hypothetical protein